MTSVIDSCVTPPMFAESVRNAASIRVASGGVGGGGGVRTDEGIVHGRSGAGGAPGTPSMRGVDGVHDAINIIRTTWNEAWHRRRRPEDIEQVHRASSNARGGPRDARQLGYKKP